MIICLILHAGPETHTEDFLLTEQTRFLWFNECVELISEMNAFILVMQAVQSTTATGKSLDNYSEDHPSFHLH